MNEEERQQGLKNEIQRLLQREAKAKAYRKEYYARNKERIKEYHRERSRMVSEVLSGAKKRAQALPRTSAVDYVVLGLTKSELDSLHLLLGSLLEEGKLGSPYFLAIFEKLEAAKETPEDFQIENFMPPPPEEGQDDGTTEDSSEA